MGLARDRLVRSTLRQQKTQFSRRRQIYHPPSDIGMGPSVCRQEDGLIWKRKFSHQASGHQAPEPQDVQSDARVGLKTVPEDNVRDSGKVRRKFRSPIEMLVNTVSHMQRDLSMIRDEKLPHG